MATYRFSDVVVIDGEDVDVEVEYEISGGYAPATFWSPAETPDIEILAVYGLDGQELHEIGLDDYMASSETEAKAERDAHERYEDWIVDRYERSREGDC